MALPCTIDERYPAELSLTNAIFRIPLAFTAFATYVIQAIKSAFTIHRAIGQLVVTSLHRCRLKSNLLYCMTWFSCEVLKDMSRRLDLHTHYYPPAFFDRIKEIPSQFTFDKSPSGQTIIKYRGARFLALRPQ